MKSDDGSVLQVVHSADPIYVLRYTRDKLWVQALRTSPAAERAQLNRIRKELTDRSNGVWTACLGDFTSELKTLGLPHSKGQWTDACVEIKALKRRLPLLEKSTYRFKSLENAVTGLENTMRLRNVVVGISFNREDIQAVRTHLPALIAIGGGKQQTDILGRLVQLEFSDLIVEANKNPYKKKSSNNPSLIKEYKSRIALLERFYAQFARERNLPSEEEIRLRGVISEGPFKAIEVIYRQKCSRPTRSVTPAQMQEISLAPVKALREQDYPGAWNIGLYRFATFWWGHLMCRRALEYTLHGTTTFEDSIMKEGQLLKATAKGAEKLKSSTVKGAITVRPLSTREAPTPFTDGFAESFQKAFPTLETFSDAVSRCGGLDIGKKNILSNFETADKKPSTVYDDARFGRNLNILRYVEYFSGDMQVATPEEYNTFLVTKGSNYIKAVLYWKIALQVNLNNASMSTPRTAEEKDAEEEQIIAGPLTESFLDSMWNGMLHNKKMRKSSWAMDFFVCLNFFCSKWFDARTHMAEEIFACSKAEWDLRDSKYNHGQHIRDGIWFVRDHDTWFVFLLFTKQERKVDGFTETRRSKEPIQISVCIRGAWQKCCARYDGIAKVLEVLPKAFYEYFGYALGQERRNYSSNVKSSRGAKVLLNHSLPNPDFPSECRQFIQYDCDPHEQDCYVNLSNEQILKRVQWNRVISKNAQSAMASICYEINGVAKVGVAPMRYPPTARALHGVMRPNHGRGVRKLTAYAVKLVKYATIGLKELILSKNVKLSYRWFGRKHHASNKAASLEEADRERTAEGA